METQIYENIRQLLTLKGAREKQGRRPQEADLGIIEDAAVAVSGGKIEWLGRRSDLPSQYQASKRVSAKHPVWIPGLVECHTHLVYGGSRVHDFARRADGKTYQKIAHAGGGILSTVKATRECSPEMLFQRAEEHLKVFSGFGAQCVEIKSGYGLTLQSEIKMLECVRDLQKRTKSGVAELVPTFLPAHAVPPEFHARPDAYVDAICREWIPEIARRKLAVFFDVFVEEGYFNGAQTRKMSEAAVKHGLKVKLHADQFTDQKATALAAQIGATSCDHLDQVSDESIRTLARSQTVAVLAPGASIFTGTGMPPARRLLDAGAIVALTTDFNPGTSPTHNLPLMLTFACSQMRMNIPEAIIAATYNAAQALAAHDRWGTIEVGRPLRVWQAPVSHFEEIPYRFGELG